MGRRCCRWNPVDPTPRRSTARRTRCLVVASNTEAGVKGVIAKGGTARREAIEKMVADRGGHLESFHVGR